MLPELFRAPDMTKQLSEKEKMIAGLDYFPQDPEIAKRLQEAKDRCLTSR